MCEAKRVPSCIAPHSVALYAALLPLIVSKQACRPPHVNIDRLRNDLFEAGLARRNANAPGGGTYLSAEELLAALLAINDRLLAGPDNYWLEHLPAARRPAASKALEKARQHGFMLGMDARWLQEVSPV